MPLFEVTNAESNAKRWRTPAAFALSCFVLSSCASFERDFRLQSCEKHRIAAEKALKKGDNKYALLLANESVSAAEGLGSSDSHLGVGLCVLGDTEKAAGHKRKSEKAYKKAIEVLSNSEKNAQKEAERQNKGATTEQLSVMETLVAEELAECRARLGDLYASENKFQLAEDNFRASVKKYIEIISKNPAEDLVLGRQLVRSLLGLARVAIDNKNTALAHESYNQALQFASAADCGEYELIDIRDEYLKLLQKLNMTKEAEKLQADVLFSQYTANGNLSISEGDLTAAEISYRKAFNEATKSVFTDRRMLRSLQNLISVFARENKLNEAIQCGKVAENFYSTHKNRHERDYDEIQQTLANYFFVSNNFNLASEILQQQLQSRIALYGKGSKQVCATYAQLGWSELKRNNVQLAEKCGNKVCRLLRASTIDRSYFYALSQASSLMLALGHYPETEELDKKLIQIRMISHSPADPFVTSLRANLFSLYHQFDKKKEAQKCLTETVAIISKATPDEKAAAFPFLGVILTCCMQKQWYDIAPPVARLCESILRNDLHGNFQNDVVKGNWEKQYGEYLKHNGGP